MNAVFSPRSVAPGYYLGSMCTPARPRPLLAASLLLLALGSLEPARADPSDGLPPPAAPLDRTTPRRALDGFRRAARLGDFALASHYLDLRAVGRDERAESGARLSRQLAYVLDRQPAAIPAAPSDDPEGRPEATTGSLVVGHVFVEEEALPLALSRVRFDDGTYRWLISRATVAIIPQLYGAFGPPGWESRLPAWMRSWSALGIPAWQWLALPGAIVVSLLFGWLLTWLIGPVARLFTGGPRRAARQAMLRAARRPLRLAIAGAVLRVGVRPLQLLPSLEQVGLHLGYSVLVVGVAWLAIALLLVGTGQLADAGSTDAEGEQRTRGLRTLIAVLRRVGAVAVVLIATAVILMQFELVRSFGVSLLASAGIAGVVLGLAAQKSLTGVIAGIQISITQPIRIGDSVVVEGEFGSIEEINLTHVVVRVWDQRRLVVPIAHFLDKPFQNWTKVPTALQGTGTVHVDYRLPVEPVRAELQRLCQASPRWDGGTCNLVVLEAGERTVVLRALVSARSATDLWDLRCELREKLLAFLAQLDGGRHLPRTRLEAEDEAAKDEAAKS